MVIERCYWPLLKLAEECEIAIGIEASALTLELIGQTDPCWISKLRDLIERNKCEFIASGYSQLIGPLVPAKVNRANFAIGNCIYEKILGIAPQTVLVNEQAFSSSMVSHYLDSGFKAMIMDWNNPASAHASWKPEWRYLPQYACDQNGNKIPVIWNNSIFFQKFQHYVYGENELDDYISYVTAHHSAKKCIYSLYANDVEIFDFRPGRFSTEAPLGPESEWQRITRLFQCLKKDNRIEIVCPGRLLDLIDIPGAGNDLLLESPSVPLPVKKQAKYNITRWAVTGRDNLSINMRCRRIYDALVESGGDDPATWKELCYLWSSDFRTHITEKRWSEYLQRLKAAEESFSCPSPACLGESRSKTTESGSMPRDVSVSEKGHIISIDSELVRADLNARRGLAIDGLWLKNVSSAKLCGTLPHGYYDDIAWGADFYTGHLTFERPGEPKLTDLEAVESEIVWNEKAGSVTVSTSMNSALWNMVKRVAVYPSAGRVEIYYDMIWESLPVGSLRLGYVTLMPESFDRKSLFFRAHNGGEKMEVFYPRESRINHGEPASFLVSAKQALAVTEGILEVGDARKHLRLEFSPSSAPLIGMITFVPLNDTFFFRCALSAREMDETGRQKADRTMFKFRISLEGVVVES